MLVHAPPGPAPELIGEVLRGLRHPRSRSSDAGRSRDSAIGRALIGLLRCVPRAGRARRRSRATCSRGCARPGCSSAPSWPTSSRRSCRGARGSRAPPRRGRCGRSDTGRSSRSSAWPTAAGAGAARADRAAGARARVAVRRPPARRPRACSARDELDEARALAAGGAPWRSCASWPARPRSSRRRAPRELRDALERLEFVSGEPPAPGGGRARPAGPARPAGAGAVPVRPAGRRLPGGPRPEPLLGEEERRRLAGSPGCASGERGDALPAERYLLLRGRVAPQELLVLSWHAADDDGQAARGRCSWRTSATCSTTTCCERAPRGPLGAADGLAAGPPSGVAGHSAARVRPRAARDAARCATSACWRSCASRLVGLLARALDPLPGRLVRRAHAAARCLEPDPEPLARGGLAHAALQRHARGLRSETGSRRLTPAEPRRWPASCSAGALAAARSRRTRCR